MHEAESSRLTGVIERITYQNPSNGFHVLRVRAENHHDLVTVIGNMPSVTVGEQIDCQGLWHNDKTYGKQFKLTQFKSLPPNTLADIEKFLGSGLIKGMREKSAKVLIDAFGEEVLHVLEHEPERLNALSGLNKKQKKSIVTSFAEQKNTRDVMIFLQANGISTVRALKIFKTYGEQTINKISENPYQLAMDIQNIGFKTADELAVRLGLPLDSVERAKAALHHLLQEYCNYGNCGIPYTHLMKESKTLLQINEERIIEALHAEIEQKKFVLITEQDSQEKYIFSAHLYWAENYIAKKLLMLMQGEPPWGEIDLEKALPAIEKEIGYILAASQKAALKSLLQHKLTIITGGPGVGKTTIINSILKIIRPRGLAISLCAPTGRAAKRLQETTGLKASTIHRLLKFQPDMRAFRYNEDNPLNLDVLIIDESSMLDVLLFRHLLRAVPEHAALIFVGDVDQLPSVAAGAVLKDMINSNKITTLRLTEIFRQSSDSSIIVNAHRINEGEMPLPHTSAQSDFYTIFADTAEEINQQLINLIAERIPNYVHCNPFTDIQVLTPMNRGALGTHALNVALQEKLNAAAQPKIERNGLTFSPGDKVIQTINNYDKEVFNGDIGYITQINLKNSIVKVEFDQKIIEYTFNECDELGLAYAISIHKSQGSEFPIVVIPIAMQHYMLLARNLIYTAVTRGKKLVVLIGEKKAMSMAVKNNRENKRLTLLAHHLQDTALNFSRENGAQN